MEDHYLTSEASGPEGAKAKAWFLNRECGYNILRIEHTMIPQSGSLATPYAPNYGRRERGYRITVDMRPERFSDYIPDIVNA